MGSTMVLPDGPPSVSRKIFSKPLKAHIKRSVTETLETERRDGSVMYKKLFIFPPPSILAASYNSPGIPCIPANRVIVINGRFFHTPIMVTVKRDIYLVVKNKIGFSIILSSMSTWLIRPNWSFKSQSQFAAMTIGAMTQGISMTARYIPRPFMFIFKRAAISIPRI